MSSGLRQIVRVLRSVVSSLLLCPDSSGDLCRVLDRGMQLHVSVLKIVHTDSDAALQIAAARQSVHGAPRTGPARKQR